MTRTTVFLDSDLKKIVVIDSATGIKWANEYFKTTQEAIQFCNDNKLVITPVPSEYITVNNFHFQFGSALLAAKTQKELNSVCTKFKAIAHDLNIKS